MKRSELFAALAAVLPLGALAIVPERKPGRPAKYARASSRVRWMIIHPGTQDRLPSHHEYGEACAVCSRTGVPAKIWHER